MIFIQARTKFSSRVSGTYNSYFFSSGFECPPAYIPFSMTPFVFLPKK